MDKTYALINLNNLKYNYERIKEAVGEKEIACVVKADAYGHGDKVVAPFLEKLGVRFFCVSCVKEALSLRKAGVKGEILILGYTDGEDAKILSENNISQAVYSEEFAKMLSENAEKQGVSVRVHIVIDTGMGRIGFTSSPEEIKKSVDLEGLLVEGVFTHYSSADMFDEESVKYTEMQEKLFKDKVEGLKNLGFNFTYIHSCNSAGALKKPNGFTNLCRIGIILYGLMPSDESYDIDLKPVLSFRSVVSMVKKLPKDSFISYGRKYKTEKETYVATVPVGYADGYRRSLEGRDVLIGGKRCPVIGRVCMDQIMVDITAVENVKMGDEVILIGEEISADEIARACGTINYEIVCTIGKRVPRKYIPEN
ncbi:MAG: alanine racemase [Oscillospiraceae bacterium]|nr:alanine racemase [Oscillospiraceae bacterium]